MSDYPSIQHYTPDPEDQEDTSAYDHVTGHIAHEYDDIDTFIDMMETFTG